MSRRRLAINGALIAGTIIAILWVWLEPDRRWREGRQLADAAPSLVEFWPESTLEGDGAEQFRKAMRLMPQGPASRPARIEDDPRRKLPMERWDAALDALQLAARHTRWQWSIDYDQPYTAMANAAADTTLLAKMMRSRGSFVRDGGGEAVRNLVALVRFSRWLQRDTPPVYRATGFGAEQLAIEGLSHAIPRLTPASLARLKEELRTMPSPTPIASAIALEKRVLPQIFRDVREGPGAGLILRLAARDVEAKLGPDLDEVARLVSLPLGDFQPAWRSFLDSRRYRWEPELLGRYAELREAEACVVARRVLLLAGIEVKLAGASAADAIEDPFGEKSIACIDDGGGWSLQSRLQYRGHTVELWVRKK